MASALARHFYTPLHASGLHLSVWAEGRCLRHAFLMAKSAGPMNITRVHSIRHLRRLQLGTRTQSFLLPVSSASKCINGLAQTRAQTWKSCISGLSILQCCGRQLAGLDTPHAVFTFIFLSVLVMTCQTAFYFLI